MCHNPLSPVQPPPAPTPSTFATFGDAFVHLMGEAANVVAALNSAEDISKRRAILEHCQRLIEAERDRNSADSIADDDLASASEHLRSAIECFAAPYVVLPALARLVDEYQKAVSLFPMQFADCGG